MNEIEAFVRDAAQRRGINPGIAVQVAKSEGGVDEPARRGTFATGSSWWPFQLHYGGPGYEYLGNVAGMGNGFTALTGWQPGDPAAWRDSVRYALNRAKASGWGAWYGAAHVGIGQWDGIDRAAPWDANGERWDYEGGSTVPDPIKLSEVLARGRSRIGDPYVWDGEQPGGFDCSGFVKWCYNGRLTSFTDTILGETERVATPAPGDIVLYEYSDSSQPGVRFPHVGLFISDALTLDARFGAGVGEHAQLSRATSTRYYRRMPGVVVDTAGAPAPPAPTPAPPVVNADQETIKGLRTAVAHLADVIVPKAAAGARMIEEAEAEALAIREQFVGPRP